MGCRGHCARWLCDEFRVGLDRGRARFSAGGAAPSLRDQKQSAGRGVLTLPPGLHLERWPLSVSGQLLAVAVQSRLLAVVEAGRPATIIDVALAHGSRGGHGIMSQHRSFDLALVRGHAEVECC
eukprot:s846_g11.t1